MSPPGPFHSGIVGRLHRKFAAWIADQAILRVQDPIRLDKYNQPQPDLALVKPRADDYTRRHPTAKDVLLIVEVADSSLSTDREVKCPLYAKAGIIDFWIIDLSNRVLLVHRQPRSGLYTHITQHLPGDRVAPLAFPKHFLDVAGLFG